MPLINGALQIGRSALNAMQGAMSVTGNNMANASTESYSRQNVMLAPTQYQRVAPGKYTGTGVALYDVRREVDDALNGRLRLAMGDSASNLVQQQTLVRVESVFNELTESDLSTRLNAFFEAWSDLQNQPEDSAARSVVLQEGRTLCNFIGEMRSDLHQIRSDLDSQVRYQVEQASFLSDQIADINQQVVLAEAGVTGSAAALRDQRDELLGQLGELVNVTTREMSSGAVNVYIGNDPLIEYASSRGLKYIEKETSPGSGEYVAKVVFSDNNMAADMTSGKIHGLITSRDSHVGGVLDELDAWTKSVIYEVNTEHSLGQGLDGYSYLRSTNLVGDSSASLANMSGTGLPWSVNNGVFAVRMINDATGQVETKQISVTIGMGGSDTTLDSLTSDLNSIDNLSAYVDASGRLVMQAGTGYTFGFAEVGDGSGSTNALSVLGVNTYFTGENGSDIAVSESLVSDPNKLAASATGEVGNGDIAGAIAMLGTEKVASLSNQSIAEYFTGMVGQVAADSKSAQDNYTAAQAVVTTLDAERQSISGVSIDEEAIHMIMFQRAFQGASRYVNMVDDMLDEVINLIR